MELLGKLKSVLDGPQAGKWQQQFEELEKEVQLQRKEEHRNEPEPYPPGAPPTGGVATDAAPSQGEERDVKVEDLAEEELAELDAFMLAEDGGASTVDYACAGTEKKLSPEWGKRREQAIGLLNKLKRKQAGEPYGAKPAAGPGAGSGER